MTIIVNERIVIIILIELIKVVIQIVLRSSIIDSYNINDNNDVKIDINNEKKQ